MLAFSHGLGKLPPSEKFVNGVAEMGFPNAVIFAWAAALSEFLCSLFVAVGLMTRISAFFVSFTMATAAYKHISTGKGDPESALTYLAIFFAIMLIGGGKLALDRRFSK
ncbi:MAG: DoxX family protein [Calditrichaeota bacterium]|nr:DoxX family protein [Calditrichota bacterium]